MSLLNITCPICTEVFNNSDDVYSTSCGHLFHFVCLNEWRGKGTSCPQCRCYNPTSHKLYLSFEESDDASAIVEEMKQKLKSSNERIIELQVQNSEIDINFMKLQEQYTLADSARRTLEANVQQMDDGEKDLMQLQRQYTECSEHTKDLEERIQILMLENESLMAGQDGNNSVALKQKLKFLQQKFDSISKQLEEEIDKNTKLSIEKMKLDSYVKNLMNGVAVGATNKSTANKSNANRQKKNEGNKNRNRKENINPRLPLSGKPIEPRNRCIRIKDLPHCLIVAPFSLIVVNLAAKLKMSISINDLIKVHFLNDNEKELFAEFRSSDLKEKFLAKKRLLKNDPLLTSVSIREYMLDDVYELYKYAKEKFVLQKSFNCIFAANNKVFVKTYKDPRSICEIMNKQQVDNLYKLIMPAGDLAEISNDNGPSPAVDENYYQIS